MKLIKKNLPKKSRNSERLIHSHDSQKARSSHRRCSVEKVFLGISQRSQENTCVRVSFFSGLRPATLLTNKLWHRCFSVNFVNFLRTPFLENSSGLLLLEFCKLFYLALRVYRVSDRIKQKFYNFTFLQFAF